MPTATNQAEGHVQEDRLNVPICCARLKGQLKQTQAIKTNAWGQAALLTDKNLYILVSILVPRETDSRF